VSNFFSPGYFSHSSYSCDHCLNNNRLLEPITFQKVFQTYFLPVFLARPREQFKMHLELHFYRVEQLISYKCATYVVILKVLARKVAHHYDDKL